MLNLVILFVVAKLGKSKATLQEVVAKGAKSISDRIYLPLSFLGDTKNVKVGVSEVAPDGPHIILRESKRTKNCVVYSGDDPNLQSLYLPIETMGQLSLIYVTIELEAPGVVFTGTGIPRMSDAELAA
jgi:Na+-transporting NADH:ubiquinone oxidoreductase subunit NqrC